jgi:hypothetical protein
MIKPTVGRVVWYRPGEHDGMAVGQDKQPLDAHIVYVHSDRVVNLVVFDAVGTMHRKTSVVLVQEGDPVPQFAHAEWMPYQTGQAKKHEEPKADAEAAAKAVHPVLTFGAAVEVLKAGKRVARAGWNGKGMWLELQRPDAHSKMSLPYIYMKTADDKLVPWLASQTDVLAEDWQIVTA